MQFSKNLCATFKIQQFAFLLIFLNPSYAKSQDRVIGFYNCENFYDTTNQANVIDEDFLPGSIKAYDSIAYETKSNHIARVIHALGNLGNTKSIAIMGVVEIENKIVLNKVLSDPLIKKYHYKYIHFDSKDIRGIDVALIYNPALFVPLRYRAYSLTDETHFNTYATRDILYVKGQLGSEQIHILINHWPSRRGGDLQSRPKRLWASTICKRIMDSIQQLDSSAKWIVMGDFNDNPDDKSIRHLGMTNPFLKPFKNGMGTLAYNDSWNLFDQILINDQWKQATMKQKNKDLDTESHLIYCKSIIYKNIAMIEAQGRYKGYPKRTYNGNEFRGGYSDHFPVALIFRQ